MRIKLSILIAGVLASGAAVAVEYRCEVERKLDSSREYSQMQISAGQFHNVVEETAEGSFVSRCSYVRSQKAVTCDRYQADHVEVDSHVRMKKFYFFRSQFDFQLFSDLTFLENNGRGGISYGTCHVVGP
jgi:hypothetical protein